MTKPETIKKIEILTKTKKTSNNDEVFFQVQRTSMESGEIYSCSPFPSNVGDSITYERKEPEKFLSTAERQSGISVFRIYGAKVVGAAPSLKFRSSHVNKYGLTMCESLLHKAENAGMKCPLSGLPLDLSTAEIDHIHSVPLIEIIHTLRFGLKEDQVKLATALCEKNKLTPAEAKAIYFDRNVFNNLHFVDPIANSMKGNEPIDAFWKLAGKHKNLSDEEYLKILEMWKSASKMPNSYGYSTNK